MIDVYRELAAEGLLLQRVTLLALYGVLDGPSDLDVVLAGIRKEARRRAEADLRWLNISGVKLFGDLIPPMRQAWTDHPYDDGTHGDLLISATTIEQKAAGLRAMVRAAHLAGLQLGVHATGDRTIQLVLDTIAEAATESGALGSADLAHTIIHGDLATSQQIERMAELGIWLNAQSGVAAETVGWLAAALGDDVADEAWRFADALAAGVLVLSSDAPVLGFDWRRGIADAEARIEASGAACDPGSRRARLHQLLRAYTAIPAQQDRAACWKGTVELGKVADLVVLAEDPFAVGAAGLPEVEVDLTVLDGRVVFERA
ncbi:amidohydrolase family protein [Leucobacter coleopterorum]|uniref:amidohydrolase family protein n=1 Tax=Leucobacter coleopterorum TaxID=2714933 RepID=UPI001FCB7092|nr:amidohydrolase family protein [Leucobacter coleopterorum]